MNRFKMNIHGKDVSWLAEKSPLGVGVMVCLIINRDQPVSTEKLEELFWPNQSPEASKGALRTLISRFRALLGELDPKVAQCIATDRGYYRWKSLPGMEIDYYKVLDLIGELEHSDITSNKSNSLINQLFTYYTGDLLGDSPYRDRFRTEIKQLQERYRELLLKYIQVMKEMDQYAEVIDACKKAISIFPYDNELNREMQEALSKTYKSKVAKEHYKYIAQLNYNYLHMTPEAELQTLYDCSDATVESLARQYDLTEGELLGYETRGAFCCDFMVFKEMYDLLVMNFCRLKNPLCLAIAMLKPEMFGNDFETVSTQVQNLKELMQRNLRKGDIMCQCSSTVFAVLLPTASEANATMVMERLQRAYYTLHPDVPPAMTFRVVDLADQYM